MNESLQRGTILLVEEDVDFRKTLAEVLEHEGYEVIPCEDTGSAAFWLGSICAPLDLILADVSRQTGAELEFWGRVTRVLPFVPLVLTTTDDESGVREAAARIGARAVLAKPFSRHDLLSVIEEAVFDASLWATAPERSVSNETEKAA